jgi:hypothetical protein
MLPKSERRDKYPIKYRSNALNYTLMHDFHFRSDILIGIYFRTQKCIVYGNKVVKIQNFSRKSCVCPEDIRTILFL